MAEIGTIRQDALALRARVVAGEVPYPDAVMDANEAVLDTLERPVHPALGQVISYGCSVAGGIGAIAACIFAIASPPLPVNIAMAVAAGVGVRAIFSIAGQLGPVAEQQAAGLRLVQAWKTYQGPLTPPVPSWRGALSPAVFKTMVAGFPETLKDHPYAYPMAHEHAHLMAVVEAAKEPTMEAVRDRLLETSHSLRTFSRLGDVLLNGAFPASLAAIVSGHGWLGAGLIAATLLGWATRLGTAEADLALRDARSIHAWSKAMAAAPAASPASIFFNKPTEPVAVHGVEHDEQGLAIGDVKIQ